MECDSVTRTIGVAFAYGEIEPTEGAVLLNNADGRGAYFPVEFETCGDFSFDDIDAAMEDEIYTQAKAKCNATEMPISGIVKSTVCAIAADRVRDSLTVSTFPDGQDYIANYVTNAINVDVSCSLVFFSWCLQYGTHTTYSFDSGNSLYYHAYINSAGKWNENFAVDHVLQMPELACQGFTQALLRADAEAAGTVSTKTDILDGYTCLVPNPLNPGEAISVVYGMDVRVEQTGAK